MGARDELLEGYRDGFADHRDSLPAETNRPAIYVVGWLNGRDDRKGQPRAFAELPEAIAKIRAERDEAVRLLRAWVHGTWSEAVEARGEARRLLRRLTTMEKRCG